MAKVPLIVVLVYLTRYQAYAGGQLDGRVVVPNEMVRALYKFLLKDLRHSLVPCDRIRGRRISDKRTVVGSKVSNIAPGFAAQVGGVVAGGCASLYKL
jgi:hypothetical protein